MYESLPSAPKLERHNSTAAGRTSAARSPSLLELVPEFARYVHRSTTDLKPALSLLRHYEHGQGRLDRLPQDQRITEISGTDPC